MSNYAPQSVLDAVYSGNSWGTIGQPINLTFWFLTSVQSYDSVPRPGFDALNASQQAAVNAAFSSLSAVANITFSLATSANDAQLAFGRYDIPNDPVTGLPLGGEAFQPGQTGTANDGDIWLNSASFMDSPVFGDYAYSTILHEIGHAVGLQHPFGTPSRQAANVRPSPSSIWSRGR